VRTCMLLLTVCGGVMQLESPGAQVDVVLTLAEMRDELSGTLTYCSDLFSHETALRMVKHLQVGRHRLAPRNSLRGRRCATSRSVHCSRITSCVIVPGVVTHVVFCTLISCPATDAGERLDDT